MNTKLPAGFEELEPLVADWSLATHDERYAKRSVVSREELRAFYNAILPRMEEILDKADEYPLGEMPEDVERLFFMALSMAEISPHIELYGGAPLVPHSFDESRFVAVDGDKRG